MFSCVNSTLNGITTIRASAAEGPLREEFDQHQNAHTSAWYLTLACMSSFGLWLDVIAVIFVAFVTYSFIVLHGCKQHKLTNFAYVNIFEFCFSFGSKRQFRWVGHFAIFDFDRDVAVRHEANWRSGQSVNQR